jgi:hypothetical protein
MKSMAQRSMKLTLRHQIGLLEVSMAEKHHSTGPKSYFPTQLSFGEDFQIDLGRARFRVVSFRYFKPWKWSRFGLSGHVDDLDLIQRTFAWVESGRV